MSNLFVYGTLLSKDIWTSIVSGDYSSDSAVLKGYARKKVTGKNYPGLIEQNGSTVEGQIYYDISEEDLIKLDEYEGEEYQRIKVSVFLASEKNIECFTYAFKREYFSRLTMSERSFNPASPQHPILTQTVPGFFLQNPRLFL
jgi:gamma-glutamylcyclotransferase (GGCT)/AIG2-like uncharacterized protein YtfP